MERKVEVSWVTPEAEKRFERNRLEFREKAGAPLHGFKFDDFSSSTVPLQVDRWSEWPGHWFSFKQILNDQSRYQRIFHIRKVLHSAESIAFEPLEKLELQHDFLEIAELLGQQLMDSERLGDSDPNEESEKRRALKALSDILARLGLSAVELEKLPEFSLKAFAVDRIDSAFQHMYRVETGMLRHDKEAQVRTSGIIYLLVPDPKSSLIDWLEGRSKYAKKGDRGTLVMADRMLAQSIDGKLSYKYPKTIRLEDVEGTGFSVYSSRFVTYRLAADEKPGLVFKKLKDESGGVPLAELPNVHNPWRTRLDTSCAQCHDSAPRLRSGIRRRLVSWEEKFNDSEVIAHREKTQLVSYVKKLVEDAGEDPRKK